MRLQSTLNDLSWSSFSIFWAYLPPLNIKSTNGSRRGKRNTHKGRSFLYSIEKRSSHVYSSAIKEKHNSWHLLDHLHQVKAIIYKFLVQSNGTHTGQCYLCERKVKRIITCYFHGYISIDNFLAKGLNIGCLAHSKAYRHFTIRFVNICREQFCATLLMTDTCTLDWCTQHHTISYEEEWLSHNIKYTQSRKPLNLG